MVAQQALEILHSALLWLCCAALQACTCGQPCLGPALICHGASSGSTGSGCLRLQPLSWQLQRLRACVPQNYSCLAPHMCHAAFLLHKHGLCAVQCSLASHQLGILLAQPSDGPLQLLDSHLQADLPTLRLLCAPQRQLWPGASDQHVPAQLTGKAPQVRYWVIQAQACRQLVACLWTT